MTEDELRDRVAGSVLGLALGDAFAAPYEGGPVGLVGALPSGDRPLVYTDDTEMAIGVVEALLHDPKIDQEFLAARFTGNFHAHRGYGWGTRRWMEIVGAGASWAAAARAAFPDGSLGNGAAMRSAPVGLRHPEDRSRRRLAAERAAEVTHQHPLGREGAVLISHAAAFALLDANEKIDGRVLHDALTAETTEEAYRLALRQAKALLARPFDPSEVSEALGNGVEALRSVPTAIHLACRFSTDFRRAVRAACEVGGDTDTIAAMTGAIVGAHVGRARLPEEDLPRLENLERLEELAELLVDALLLPDDEDDDDEEE